MPLLPQLMMMLMKMVVVMTVIMTVIMTVVVVVVVGMSLQSQHRISLDRGMDIDWHYYYDYYWPNEILTVQQRMVQQMI